MGYKNLKQLAREVKELCYDQENFNILRNIDRYAAFGEGTNVFLDINPVTRQEYIKHPETHKFETTLFITYLIEMFVYLAKGEKHLYINTPYWLKYKPVNPSSIRSLLGIANLQYKISNISGRPTGPFNSIANILLPLSYEQMDIQDNYKRPYNRFFTIFANHEEVVEIFKNRVGLTIKEYMALSWAILAFCFIKKNTIFTLKSFTEFLSEATVGNDEIKSYLEMISLTRDEFKSKYEAFRKQDNGDWFSYEERAYFDKALPKISFFYPLLRSGDTYELISFSGMQEFLKMRSIYRHMTEQFDDIKFKSRYVGPLFENYVRNFISDYNNKNELGGRVYGDEEYTIKKGVTYKEPDVIFETDDYLVIIECKTSAYSLNIVRYLDESNLDSLKESIETSKKNIDERFLLHQYKNTQNKTIIRILVFAEGNPFAFSLLKPEINKMVDTQMFFVMDIDSLELLFSNYVKPIPEILEDYFDFIKKDGTFTINTYIRSILHDYESNTSDAEKQILKELASDILGLDVPKEGI